MATAGPPTLAPVEDEGKTAVHEIQGSGRTSPLAGQAVTTGGVVTAVDSNGFYLQDPIGDGDDATSDGIFVFTGRAPAVRVGDAAQVAGTVGEFFPRRGRHRQPLRDPDREPDGHRPVRRQRPPGTDPARPRRPRSRRPAP